MSKTGVINSLRQTYRLFSKLGYGAIRLKRNTGPGLVSKSKITAITKTWVQDPEMALWIKLT